MGLLGLMYLFVHKYTARCITGTSNYKKKPWKISSVLKENGFTFIPKMQGMLKHL